VGSDWGLTKLLCGDWAMRAGTAGEWSAAMILQSEWGAVEISAGLPLRWQPVMGCQLGDAAIVELAHVSNSGAVGDRWRSRLAALWSTIAGQVDLLLSCCKRDRDCDCHARELRFCNFTASYR
jgi:hypothetical protein